VTQWLIYVPGVVIVLGGVLGSRWLMHLQRRVDDHAERIAYLEGRGNRED
jgi:hypothetical protein